MRSIGDAERIAAKGTTIATRPVLVLSLMCVLAGVLRFTALGKHEFRLDEVLSWYCARYFFDWPQPGPQFRSELTSIPYFGALSVWSGMFGQSETAMRSLSALFSLFTVPVLAATGYRCGGPQVAVSCAIVAAVSPLAVWYAQLARVYALWAMLTSAAALLLWHAATSDRPRFWFAYGLLLWLALFTHYFTIFWLPCTLFALAIAGDRRRILGRWAATHLIVGISFLPILLWFAWPVASRGSGAWLTDYWQVRNHWLAVPQSLAAFLPAGEPPDYLHTFTWSLPALRDSGWVRLTHTAKWLALPLLIVLLIGAGRHCFADRRYPKYPDPGRTVLFWSGLAMGPLILSWLYSMCVRPNYLVGRYDFMCWPAWIVTVSLLIRFGARGISERHGHGLAPVMTFGLAAVAATYTWGMFRVQPTWNVRDRMDTLIAVAGNQAWVVLAADRWDLLYDLHRRGFQGELVSYPSSLERQIGWRDIHAELADLEPRRTEAGALARRVRRRLLSGMDAWVLVRNYASENDPVYDVDRLLFAALNDAGIEIQIADRKIGLGRLALSDTSARPRETFDGS